LCVWLLWVFKFFFGFLSSRRSAWNHALHSFHSALGEIEMPFFGVSRKRRREKRRRNAPFFAVLIVDGVRRGCAGLWASATSLRRLGGGRCLGRRGGGRARRRGGHKRRRGPTGARGAADSRIRSARESLSST
jgi:hypothetical protein